MDRHIGQAYWTGILTVLFFNMPVRFVKCAKISLDVCPAARVKSEFLGYNGSSARVLKVLVGVAAEAAIFARLSFFDEEQFLPRHQSPGAQCFGQA